ncbi:hypothetical protein BCR42DRAFT_489649 [Absidia repens]|uniref:NDT80 domain-containing protein n=1 Tax=Absidia repens TaxID=90262 RepID=A0A1X2IP22_9FUNG|nr:hypothetical protein BCR42DRAFT_489649 [Absidia repens]
MLHPLPKTHSSSVSKSTVDPSAYLEHASRNQLAEEYSQDYVRYSENMATSSPIATNAAAATGSSSPAKSSSPTAPNRRVSTSQPTTPQPTSDSSSSTSQHVRFITTQPSSSPSSSSPPPVSAVSPASTSPPPSSQHQSHSVLTPEPPVSNTILTTNAVNVNNLKGDINGESPVFGRTKYLGNVYAADQSTVLDVTIQSNIGGGFFLVHNDWTCYRRNYFQITSEFLLKDMVALNYNQDLPCYVRDDEQTFHQVQQFYVGIDGQSTANGTRVALVQLTTKRDRGAQTTPELKPIRPAGAYSLSKDDDIQPIVSFERMQFKTATGNNGKYRSGTQKYFAVVVELFAKTESSDDLILVATTTSQGIVVRGRSPGHYADQTHRHNHPANSTSTLPMKSTRHYSQPYSSHAPPPIGMYPPGYVPYYYSAGSDTLPPRAGVPRMPNGASSSSTSGSYSYYPPIISRSQPATALRIPALFRTYGYSYQYYYSSQHTQPSDSASSIYDQSITPEEEEDHKQRVLEHRHQQEQYWERVRIATTSNHRYLGRPSPGHDETQQLVPNDDHSDTLSLASSSIQTYFPASNITSRPRPPLQNNGINIPNWKHRHFLNDNTSQQEDDDHGVSRKKIRLSNDDDYDTASSSND